MAAVSTVLAVVIFLPQIYGWLSTPPDKVFMWSTILNKRDLYTYVGWIEQSSHGHILTTNMFTTEEHRRLLFRPLLLLGGLISLLPGVSAMAAFQILRFLSTGIVIGSIYYLIARYITEISKRRLLLLIVASSSGIGWLSGTWPSESIDTWVPEAVTFAAIYQSPHFSISLALMLFILSRFHTALSSSTSRGIPSAGLAGALLAWIHPYDVVSVVAICLAWCSIGIVRDQRERLQIVRSFLFLLVLMAPGILYQFAILRIEPMFGEWTEAITGGSPKPYDILTGLGLLWPFAGLGVLLGHEKHRTLIVHACLWISITLVLVYLPFAFQRRLIQGLHIPVAILAGLGLNELVARISSHRRRFALVITATTVIVLSLTNLRMLVEDTRVYSRHIGPHHIEERYVRILQWLHENVEEDSRVLSSLQIGSLVPALAGCRTYLGHPELTIRAYEKARTVERFFSTDRDYEAKLQFLREVGINYVVVSPFERRFGSPSRRMAEYLALVHTDDGIDIYEVPGA